MGLIDVLFLATALTGPQSAGSIEEDWAAFDGAVRVEVRNPQLLTTTLPCIIEVRLTNVMPRVEFPFADRKHDELTPNEQRIQGERASTLSAPQESLNMVSKTPVAPQRSGDSCFSKSQ